MSRPLLTRTLTGALLSLTVGACTAPQVGSPCPIPTNADAETRNKAVQQCFGLIAGNSNDFRLKKDVDILFVIDNSPSMSPKQKALAENIPKFIQKIDSFGVNYHVGIVTTDVGTTVSDGATWGAGSEPSCDTFSGDDGRLQDITCDKRNTVSPEASNACATLCPDNRFKPTDGTKYISKIDGKTNVPTDLKLDSATGQMVDYGPTNAFKCMALVGDAGCGVEGPLEAVKRAISNSANTGFIRDNSVLAVIFITDEDDCSVKAARRSELNPGYRNCNAAQPDSYDCYKVDYRCMARSLTCNEPMTTASAKTGCKERVDNFLEPVQTYYDALLKVRSADKLLVSGIWTIPNIDTAATSGGKVTIVGGPLTSDLRREAACVNSTNSAVVGQPQFRMSQLANLFGKDSDGISNAPQLNVCDTANYPAALDTIAKTLEKKLVPCLPITLKTVNGQPICLVGDVDSATPDAVPEKYFPTCSTGCCDAWASTSTPSLADKGIQAACAGETTDACYCAIKSKDPNVCKAGTPEGGVNGGVVTGVWRKNNANPPAGKVVNFRCVGY
ncbi:MAG: hypothetical protein U0745_15045 [Polyangia bacterium]